MFEVFYVDIVFLMGEFYVFDGYIVLEVDSGVFFVGDVLIC